MGNIEIFNQIAKTYDTPERIEVSNICIEKIKEHLDNTKEKQAIDFGCGTGSIGFGLANHVKQMFLVDASVGMIEYVKEKSIQQQYSNVKALCLDLEIENKELPKVDYIFMTQVLLHIEDSQDILAKLYTALNDNGHLIIIDFNKNDEVISDVVHNGFDQEVLSQLMKKIGFTNVKSETIYHGKKMFMGKDASIFIMDAKK